MADDVQRWFALDGTWHRSVASKLSALHLDNGKGAPKCNPKRAVLDTDDVGYTEKEAEANGRTICARCRAAMDRTTAR